MEGRGLGVGGGSALRDFDDGSVGCGAHVGVGGSESSVDDLQISSDALAALFVVIDDFLMYVSHVVDHLGVFHGNEGGNGEHGDYEEQRREHRSEERRVGKGWRAGGVTHG